MILWNPILAVVLWLIRVLAPFFPGEFLSIRNNWETTWREGLAKVSPEGRVWFHVSSVGELEQVRPVIEELKRRGVENVVLSYFSPSVPRLVKDWSFVGFAGPLPLDEEESMTRLMDLVAPRLLVLNRYDIWPNHIAAAKKKGVTIALVNASTPPRGWWGWLSLWLRRGLFQSVQAWTYVDSAAAHGWEPWTGRKAKGLVAGNPRVDRAVERAGTAAREAKASERIRSWLMGKGPVVVAGSTWPQDEVLVLEAFAVLRRLRGNAVRLVLVPHEPHESHLQEVEAAIVRRGFTLSRYSGSGAGTDVLLVDARGFLAELYVHGAVAYVGGGFGKQIHSIIEPIAHGKPVAFGPAYHRSPEARTLLSLGAALTLPHAGKSSGERLGGWWHSQMSQGGDSKRAHEAIEVFLGVHRGAGHRVGEFLAECWRSSAILRGTGGTDL